MDAKNLFALVLSSIIAFLIVALGGGVFGQQEPWQLQWQHQAFGHLCHQMPDRSFWISGQPMAVCSRCLGIYSGFALGWILLPFSSYFNILEHQHISTTAIAVVIINLVDIVGNLVGFWQNSLISRLILGGSLGLVVALLFSGSYFRSIIKSMDIYNGRIRI
jgi:uncharacterized membrane protein